MYVQVYEPRSILCTGGVGRYSTVYYAAPAPFSFSFSSELPFKIASDFFIFSKNSDQADFKEVL